MSMEVCKLNQQKQMDPMLNMFKETCQQSSSNVDYGCLEKYHENNTHFSMAIILENVEGEQERVVGYNCIYRYGTYRIKLEYDISTGIWKTVSGEFNQEEQKLNLLLDDLNNARYLLQCLTLDQQIQIITKRLDQHFFEMCQEENVQRFENKTSIFSSLSKEVEFKYVNNELSELSLHQGSTSTTIPEDDEQQKCANYVEKDVVDYGLHSFITGSRPKFSGLAPPPVAPRRSRQNSACSTQSSVRYASFNPPPIASVRRRRVIESIVIHVQRKKKAFEKIVDVLKRTEPPSMYDLGSEFLRQYDGKFNYRQGHTFVMLFRKKTWFLTIEQIKCVDCPLGDIGPRSVLVLSYKSKYTSVHM